MKRLNRSQLRRIIKEAVVTATQAEVEASQKKLEDEGGAAGPDMIAQAARDAEEGDDELTDDTVLASIMKADPSIKKHRDGDIINTGGINMAEVRKIIKRSLKNYI